MAYSTPSYDYGRASSNLSQEKGMRDASRDYGQFISQESFRRNKQDAGNQFKRGMPRVGSAFNRRGMYNSGLRQSGQRQYAQDYQQDLGRMNWDQGAQNQGYEMARTQDDARYQMALQGLFERLQAARATGYDPFSGVRGVVK